MLPFPVRLHPDQDVRAALAAVLTEQAIEAAYVLQGIGSLSHAELRLAGADTPLTLHGDLEILTLAGTLGPDGVHLHMTVADATGRVLGGHVATGCLVRTTAEVLLLLLPQHRFGRAADAVTGYAELVIGAATPPVHA